MFSSIFFTNSSIIPFPLRTMALLARHQFEIFLLVFFSIITYASYNDNTTTWLQWLTLTILIFFSFIFDVSFSDSSSFLFDPDADNWRRKTEKR